MRRWDVLLFAHHWSLPMILVFLFLSLPCSNAPVSRMHILLRRTSASTRSICAIACHEQWGCRTFDYDPISGQCRLYEGDLSTGSIVASSSLESIVVTVDISSDLYSTTYDQPCEACTHNRYVQCELDTCQCPPHTYWNGSQCLLQLFENQVCTQVNACRQDLNLTCFPSRHDTFSRCSITTVLAGTTVAGLADGTAGSSNDRLSFPRGIALVNNGTTLIVAEEGNHRLQAFNLTEQSGIGSLLMTTVADGEYPSFVISLNDSLYVSIPAGNRIHIWPSNATIPLSPPFDSLCDIQYLVGPMGISMDSAGGIYVASQSCHAILRWKGSNVTEMTGMLGASGSSDLLLSYPAGIAVDDQHDSFYVADFSNHRIQKFHINGNGSGITVAGGNGPGAAPNQLFNPVDVCVSQRNGAIYVADHSNNRVQRWDINATQGMTVAGNPTGSAGVTPMDLHGPFAIVLDPKNEAFLYVSDYHNHRVLRFSLSP